MILVCVYAGGIPNQAFPKTGFRMGVTQPENASLFPAKGPKVLHHLLLNCLRLLISNIKAPETAFCVA